MRIEKSYPTPIQGVSTVPARSRVDGQLELQENLRSDPVTKMKTRAGMTYDQWLISNTGSNIHEHTYVRGEDKFRVIAESSTGQLFLFKNDLVVGASSNPYLNNFTDLVMTTIDHDTYVVNREIKPAMVQATDNAGIPKVVHVNIISAVNYLESVTLNLHPVGSGSTGGFLTVTYTAPAAGGSDAQRATDYVAAQLAVAVNTLTSGIFSAISKGSTLVIWETNNSTGWVHVDVETGQGDNSAIVVNQNIESTEGLPLYAVNGTRIKVQPNPASDNGVYYLQAEATNENSTVTTTPANYRLEEVVWVQSRAPDEWHEIDQTTMPIFGRYDPEFNTWAVVYNNWDERQVGDDDTVKRPAFIGKQLDDLGFFQNRMVLLADNTVSMTKTDDINDWFKQSAIQLLVTDPISITSSDTDIDDIKHMVSHNRELFFNSANKQLKIGSAAITPQTSSLTVTTSIPTQTSVRPVAMGSALYLPISYGDSTGIIEYRAEKDTTQDEGVPITNHVTEYLIGDCIELKADHNLNMLLVRTDGTPTNEFFIYEQFFNEQGTRIQQAWSKWILPSNVEILNCNFIRSRLDIMYEIAGEIYSGTIPMYEQEDSIVSQDTQTSYSENLYLDYLYKVTSNDGLTAIVPTKYPVDGELIAVGGNGSKYPLFSTTFTRLGNVITFDQALTDGTPCTVYVGRRFNRRFIPTRPFIKDDQGVAINTDRIRINRYHVGIEDTRTVSMKIVSDYSDFPDQTFTSRVVGTSGQPAATITKSTGDVMFSFGHDPTYAYPEFYSDDFLNVQFTALSWAGQYHKSSRRL